MRVRVEFKLADMWVGVFWRKSRERWAEGPEAAWPDLLEHDRVDVWICLVPCFPLHVVWWGKDRPHDIVAADDREEE